MNRPLPVMVKVWWDDAASDTGWHGRKSAARSSRRRYKVRSVGFLISDTKRGVTLATSVNCYGGFGDLLKIPRGMVLRVRKLG